MGVATDPKAIDPGVCIPSTVMQKSAGSSSSSSKGVRLNPRKIWARSRSKSQSRASGSSAGNTIWATQGGGVWTCSSTGRQVCLTDGHLLNLSEAEVIALRHVATAKLQAMDLGCSISMPKTSEGGAAEKPKRRALILKRRAATTGFLDGNKDSNVRGVDSGGQVFGVPLVKCVRNDRASRRSASAPLRDVANLLVAHLKTGSASAEDISNERLLTNRGYLTASQSSCNIPLDVVVVQHGESRTGEKNDDSSIESLGFVCKSRSVSGLSMLEEFQDWASNEPELDPLVPNIVNTCFRHIESYGLNRLGIFRVSSSKKRVRQLREDFDTGKEVQLSEDHCPHDVATLLKEYFRDLPEPLLTRDLYLAFIATQRIRNRRQQMDALRHLVQMLPVANRDTLWALLRFLAKVATHAEDQRTDTGEWVAGNKMDANNLATLFGPNVLHMAKSTSTSGGGSGSGSGGYSAVEYQVESVKRADERIEVIKAVRTMIDNYRELYEVPASLMDDIYRRLLKHNPDDLGRLLQARLLPLEIEIDPDTGSSACSETTSVAHLSIDVAMEVSPASGPLVINLSPCQSNSAIQHSHSSESCSPPTIPVDQLARLEMDGRRESGENGRTERAGSLGREMLAKTESVASRLFRRRDKSAVRAAGEENRERRSSREDKSESDSTSSSRWFRRKDRDTRTSESGCGNTVQKKTMSDESKKKIKKEAKEQKNWAPATRGSVSEGSIGGGSDSRSSSLKSASADSMKSQIRPLMFQEMSNQGDTDKQQKQVSVVDIRKEHLHVQDGGGGERRLSTSDLEVISASLTLKVPLSRSQTGPALAFGQDAHITHDIPFIEDNQPEAYDSPSGGARQRYLDRRHKSSPFFQKESSAADSVASGREYVRPTARARQRTTSSSTSTSVVTSNSASSVIENDDSVENQKSRRDLMQRHHRPSSSSTNRRSSGTTSIGATNQWPPQETWKRWEIISSEHTEQETVV